MNNTCKSWESLVTLLPPSDCWVEFWTNGSDKQKNLFLYTPTKKSERFHIWNCHVTKTKKGKNLLIWKFRVTMTKKDAYKTNKLQLQNHPLSFIHKNKSILLATSNIFRSPMAYNTTASLDKLTFTNSADFGKMLRQIRLIFLVQKWFQLLGCENQNFQEIRQQRVRNVPKSYNGRSRVQPVYAIEESADHCSRKICKRGKFVPSADNYNVQRHGWTIQTHSLGCWYNRQSKQKALCDSVAVQCGQTRKFYAHFPFLQGRRRTRSFKILSFWIISFKILSMYLM